jgi:hypothetical protein
MINITVDPISANRMYLEIHNKIDGIKELKSSQTKKQLMDVAFSMAALKFVKRTNLLARANKSSFHHVYEWGGVGAESSRLFRIIKKGEAGGSASIYYKFNNSKKNAPIAPALKTPGSTGRVVSKSGVFKRKAEVMESGSGVSFVTSRTIAIAPGGSLVFIPPGKTINIKNPGGVATSGSFEKHFKQWWSINFPNILDERGVINKIENNVASALKKNGAGRDAAKRAISSTLNRYKIVGSII